MFRQQPQAGPLISIIFLFLIRLSITTNNVECKILHSPNAGGGLERVSGGASDQTFGSLVELEEIVDDEGTLDEEEGTRFELKLPPVTKPATDLNLDSSVTSGARSAYPMTPFGDPFNLFNLFNVFRGSTSELMDDKGNIVPLDGDQLKSESSPRSLFSSDLFNSSLDFRFGAKLSEFSRSIIGGRGNARNLSGPSSPVILVPGYGGSRLEARLDKPSVVRYFCDYKSDWSDIWINVKQLLPYMIDCLIDNLRLELDYSTNKTRNTPGVEIRVKTNTSDQLASVEYLNDLPIVGFAYFAPIIDQLVGQLNYERESSIRGAPYDFRKAPNELGEYFSRLKETSEQIYQENKQKSVTFICHSMGCNNMLYFLQNQSKEWKDIYVRRLISIAAPWAGSLSALRAAALGDDLGMPYLFSESKLIRVQRSLPSTIFLFPHHKAFANIPLIRSNTKSQTSLDNINSKIKQNTDIKKQEADQTVDSLERAYYSQDYKSFFEDINHPDGYRIWLNTKDLLGSLEAPGVEVWCLVGKNHKTLGRLEYTGEFPHSSNVELYDDGDGTVSLQSASYCKHWSNRQDQSVYYKEFDAGHMEILKSQQILRYIERILSES